MTTMAEEWGPFRLRFNADEDVLEVMCTDFPYNVKVIPHSGNVVRIGVDKP